MDNLTKAQRKKNMQHIKSKNTKPEMILRLKLWHKGLRYRKNYLPLIGKPDIVFVRQKIAIFVDGDFWHGKDLSKIKKQVKSNRSYWIHKIQRNMERDKEVNDSLTADGWLVLRFWESDIKLNTDDCVENICSYLP